MPSTKPYKAGFRPAAKCIIDSERISRVIIPICMNYPSHQGGKIRALIALLNKQDFIDSITFITTGYLNRHKNHLARDSESLDKEWMAQHRTYLEDLNTEYTVITWKDIINQTSSVKWQHRIRELVIKDCYLHNLCQQIASNFARKYKEENYLLSSDECFQAAINYTLEEAASLVIFAELGFDAIAYPGKESQIMSYIANKYNKKINWLEYTTR